MSALQVDQYCRGDCDACGTRWRVLTQIKNETVTFKCAACGDVTWTDMPQLDKRVLYLDQNAISDVFKVRTGTMRPNTKHFDFWTKASRLIEQAAMLQQLVCPASDIHRDESMVFSRGKELSLTHEMLGGEVSFEAAWEVERSQLWEHLKAFETGAIPNSNFAVDDILYGNRNEWLPRLHVTVDMDWSAFAEEVRTQRNVSADDMSEIYNRWRNDPTVTFSSVLDNELNSFGLSRIQGYSHFADMATRGLEEGDMDLWFNGANSGPISEFRQLREHFMSDGMDRPSAEKRVVEFWKWPGNKTIVHHRIQSYLFAAMARKIVAGQKKNPSRGALNDIRAIAAYAPYVDAIFVDNEFATYLGEMPLRDELTYRAKVFSLRSQEAFLDYLEGIVSSASIDVEMVATALYGDGARRKS